MSGSSRRLLLCLSFAVAFALLPTVSTCAEMCNGSPALRYQMLCQVLTRAMYFNS